MGKKRGLEGNAFQMEAIESLVLLLRASPLPQTALLVSALLSNISVHLHALVHVQVQAWDCSERRLLLIQKD